MGISYTHGDRSTGPSKHSLRPLDLKAGVCAECGERRDVLVTPLGEMHRPLAGTWWHVHPGGATCSLMCRIMGNFPAGPYDML